MVGTRSRFWIALVESGFELFAGVDLDGEGFLVLLVEGEGLYGFHIE